MKRILAIGIILLFIGMSISASTGFTDVEQSTTPLNDKTLYVGGSGPNNYTKIQDAIYDAYDGYTIYVYDDSSPYYENVVIHKYGISLIGEDKNTTVIDGSENADGNVVRIQAGSVSIKNFQIRRGKDGIRVETPLNYLRIVNCIIYGNEKNCIGIMDGSYNKIVNCHFYNSEIGIYLYSSSYNQIINCIANKNSYGIHFSTSSDNNQVFNCKTYNNGLGIYLLTSRENDFVNCITFSNYNDGINLAFCKLNQFIHCITYNNRRGIIFTYDSNKNTVAFCNISDNNCGVETSSSNYNHIYHNNFIRHNNNAKDKNNNTWDDGYPSGGNYWDDYNGTDEDGDGIGDTPYPIPKGENEDRYPLMESWEESVPPFIHLSWTPTIPNPEKMVLFNASRSFDADGYIISYEWDWNNDGVFDEIHSIPTATHSWPSTGDYQVTLRVTDNAGLTETITISIIVNYAPNKPTIDGPTKGIPGVKYNYTFLAYDPDNDWIYYDYYVVFGPFDIVEGTMGPYSSGTPATKGIKFPRMDTFAIKVRTIDILGKKSDYAQLSVTIPKSKNIWYLGWLERFPILNQLITRIMERWNI